MQLSDRYHSFSSIKSDGSHKGGIIVIIILITGADSYTHLELLEIGAGESASISARLYRKIDHVLFMPPPVEVWPWTQSWTKASKNYPHRGIKSTQSYQGFKTHRTFMAWAGVSPLQHHVESLTIHNGGSKSGFLTFVR